MVLIKPASRRQNDSISIWKALLYAVLGICLILASERHYHNKVNTGLRGETSIASSTTSASVEQKANAAVVVTPSPPKPSPPKENPVVSAPPPSKPATPIIQNKVLCGRNIGIDLSDHSKWSDYTPSYFDKDPESAEAVVLISDRQYGNTLIVGLFHAIDLAYDKKCEVMMTEDANWIWYKLATWIHSTKIRDDAFYKSMEEVFNVKVVESLEAATALKSNIHKLGSQAGFYARSESLDVVKIRNRRDTIYRKLFALPNPPCEGVAAVGIKSAETKYAVIDVPVQDPWNAKFDATSGNDHTHAYEMKPEYVKAILNSVDLGDKQVFLGKTQGAADPNREEVQRLMNDVEIQTRESDVADNLFLAVLADCFIGSPASHYSLMVARMRYALGMANTFVLTKKAGDSWVSYVNDDHLILHDPKKMGLWYG